MAKTNAKVIELVEPTNGGASAIIRPWTASVTIQGTADYLFHGWNCEAIEAKGKAAKNSAAKKTDDLESYVYRTDDGELAVMGECIRQAVVAAARYKQDPRSPRKSARDLYKAAIIPLDNKCSFGAKKWDYEDKRRVVIQQSGVNRTRPAMKAGWQITCRLLNNLPEYISPQDLCAVLNDAGRLGGLGDFRPTFGRFTVKNFEIVEE